MRPETSQFKYYPSGYTLDEINFIIAVRESSRYTNVIPLFYVTEHQDVMSIDLEEVGDRIYASTSQNNRQAYSIENRFEFNELIKLSRGSIQNRIEWKGNEPKTWIHASNLDDIKNNEVIEILKGKIDLASSTIELHNSKIATLIQKKYLNSQSIFFVLDDSQCIGPILFLDILQNNQFKVSKSNAFTFGIYKFEPNNRVDFSTNGIERSIIFPESIEKSYVDNFDFVSDEDLLKWFETEVISEENSNSDLSASIMLIKNSIDTIPKNVENATRFERLEKMLRQKENIQLSKSVVLKLIPELKSVKEEINTFQKLRFDLQNLIYVKEEEKGEIEKEINDYELLKNKLVQDIESLKKSEKEFQDNQISKIKKEIDDLESKKMNLEKEIDSEYQIKSSELDGQLAKLKENVDYYEKRKEELKNSIGILEKEFITTQKESHEKLRDLVKFNTSLQFLSGRDIVNLEKDKVPFKNFSIHTESEIEYTDLKNQIISIFEVNDRNYVSHFIDNILISIHQNTLTFFAGLPGTGKTSLARLLANSIAPKERVVEIPVSRGWTSQKDLIGFKNPLNNKFQESSTGLFKLLNQLNYEIENNLTLQSPISYVILDEANLSPIEHYWSLFYATTDQNSNFERSISLNLGMDTSFKYGNNIRFIGTINNDQTTEDLSPRIVDRVNIITLLRDKNLMIDKVVNAKYNSIEISFQNLINIFQLPDYKDSTINYTIPESIQKNYLLIKNIFSENLQITISPRVDLSIRKYLSVASKYMIEELRPLDYCIAQRLMPLINIQIDRRKELEHLLEVINKFNLDESISAMILKKIIDIGSRNDFGQDNYNYFLALSHA